MTTGAAGRIGLVLRRGLGGLAGELRLVDRTELRAMDDREDRQGGPFADPGY